MSSGHKGMSSTTLFFEILENSKALDTNHNLYAWNWREYNQSALFFFSSPDIFQTSDWNSGSGQPLVVTTNKSNGNRKQIQPMWGCHCYYLWSLSLNRLLARCARNGQSGLDCINYSSSPLYMALHRHTIQSQTNFVIHPHRLWLLQYHTLVLNLF